MNRDNLLQEATLLFLKNGYNNYTMDQLSTHLKIGKNTIYKRFGTKKELIREVLKYRKDLIYKIAAEVRLVTKNALENYFELNRQVDKLVPLEQQRKNLLELKNGFPQLFKIAISDVIEITSVCFEAIYLRGFQEGLFCKHESEQVGKHFSKIFFSYRMSENIESLEKMSLRATDLELIFIKGLLTDKGRTILKNCI